MLMGADGTVAAVMVLAMLLAWAGAHSIALEKAAGAAAAWQAEARVVAAADWLVKERRHDFSGWDGRAGVDALQKNLGLLRLEVELREYGGRKVGAGPAGDVGNMWCVKRAVRAGKAPAVLMVCGR